MKFISNITGGFYYSVDENLDSCTILDRGLFYFYNISHHNQQNQYQQSQLREKATESGADVKIKKCTHQHHFNLCDENDTEEKRGINLIKCSDKISYSNKTRIMKKLVATSYKVPDLLPQLWPKAYIIYINFIWKC